jgi:hypothetical protein
MIGRKRRLTTEDTGDTEDKTTTGLGSEHDVWTEVRKRGVTA